VLPEFRGQGLQKRLIRIRLKTAKAIGMNWAVTDTYDNPASGNNMIACGFKLFIPSDPWGVGRTLYWRKRILHEHGNK
jgi:GNAT superfamily N-acetyltransferase